MSRVRLNVGGKIFETSIDLLCEKSEYFRAMLKGGFRETQEKEIFIDRDPAPFKHVMRLIRDPSYVVPEEYIEDLRYYMIEIPPNGSLIKAERSYSLPGHYIIPRHLTHRWTSAIHINNRIFRMNFLSSEQIRSMRLVLSIPTETRFPTIEFTLSDYVNPIGNKQKRIIDHTILEQSNKLHVNERLATFRADLEETSALRILDLPPVIIDYLKGLSCDVEIGLPYDDYTGILFVETETIKERDDHPLPVMVTYNYDLPSRDTAYWITNVTRGNLIELWIQTPNRHLDYISFKEHHRTVLEIPGYIILEQMIERNMNIDTGIYCWSFGSRGWQTTSDMEMTLYFFPTKDISLMRELSSDLKITYTYIEKEQHW